MQQTRVRSLGQEDPLEEEMATHSSILAWRIPWTEEPGRLQSMGLQKVGHDWMTSLLTFKFFNRQRHYFCFVMWFVCYYFINVTYTYTHTCVHAEWFSHVWPFCDLMECSPPDSLCPWQELDKNFPDKNTRVGCRFIFVTLWYRYYT